MDREEIVWGLACFSCMNCMTDDQIIDICERHSNVFELKGNIVNFTKTFLDEATKIDLLS